MSAPQVLHTVAEVTAVCQQLSSEGKSLALVPTMGALHAGHMALVERARELVDAVMVSIFVNPLQFGAGEDFDRYPRTLDADVAALDGKADYVFAPDVNEVYPDRVGGRPVPAKHAGSVGDIFEGASRPGHFDGVLTAHVLCCTRQLTLFVVAAGKRTQASPNACHIMSGGRPGQALAGLLQYLINF